MAKGLKGIVIEIGGDSSKFGAAIKDAQDKCNGLTAEARTLNKALKLDPKNVDALRQKQEALKTATQAAKDKLQALKDTLAAVDSGEIQMSAESVDQLKSQIALAEAQVKKCEQAEREFGGVTAQVMKAAAGDVRQVSEALGDAADQTKALSAAAGAVTLPSIALASSYEDAVAQVATIMDKGTMSVEDMSDAILKLSDSSGMAANEVAAATYQAISGGVATGDALEFVASATDLAKAGFTDTSTAVDILTTAMNSYGMSADDAAQLSNTLLQAQNDGKLTVGQLASGIGNATSLATAYGVSIDDLCASYVEMTKQGLSVDESGTAINAVLQELGDNGSQVAGILKDKTGMSFAECMASGMSLGDVIGVLSDSVNGSSEDFINLWGNVRASKGAMKIATAGTDEYNAELDRLSSSSGLVESALSDLDTSGAKGRRTLNELKNAAIDLGGEMLDTLAPALDKAKGVVDDIREALDKMDPSTRQALGTALMVVTAISPVLLIGSKVAGVVADLMGIVGSLVGFVSGTLVPGIQAVGAAVAGVIGWPATIAIAVVALLATLYATCEPFRDFVNGLIDGIKSALDAAVQWVQDRFNDAVAFFQGLPATFEGIWNDILAFVQGIPAAVGEFVQGVIDWFSQLPYNIGFAIGTVIGTIANWGTSLVNFVTVDVPNFVSQVGEWFAQLPGNIWNAITGAITNLATWGSQMLSTATTAVSNVVTTVWTWMQQVPGKVWSAVSSAPQKIADMASQMWDKAKSGCERVGSAVLDGLRSIPDKVGSIGRNIVEGLWNGITGAAGWIQQKVGSFAQGILDGMKGALGIHSPSKAFRDQVGKWIPKGIAVGIDANADAAVSSLRSLGDTMAQTIGIDTGLGSATDMIGSVMARTQERQAATYDDRGVLSAIDALTAQMGRMQVILDTGTIAGAVSADVDRAIGARTRRRAGALC